MTPKDEQDALAWLREFDDNGASGPSLKHSRTLLAMLASPRMPRDVPPGAIDALQRGYRGAAPWSAAYDALYALLAAKPPSLHKVQTTETTMDEDKGAAPTALLDVIAFIRQQFQQCTPSLNLGISSLIALADAAESTLAAKSDDLVLRAAIERVEEFSKGGFVSSMYLSGLTGELHTVLEAARSTLPKTKTVTGWRFNWTYNGEPGSWQWHATQEAAVAAMIKVAHCDRYSAPFISWPHDSEVAA